MFEIVPVVLGATGLVTSDLQKNPEKLGISSINDMLAKCQQMALLGTMKIVKSFMRMKNDWKLLKTYHLVCWKVLSQGNMM